MTPPADGLPSNYRFADLTLDVARRCVTRQGHTIELKALDFDLLRFLVEQAPNVVNADVLAEKVWGRHFVSPENVAQRVMLLRQSLSDDANRPRYIETVRNKGYRLIPVVAGVPADALSSRGERRRWVTAAVLLLVAAAGYWLIGTVERPFPLPKSVAVLPFENLSPDPANAYIAPAMHEAIVSQLIKVSGLSVVPVRLRDGTKESLDEVIRGLNVETLLDASVYYSGGRMTITPHLTNAATGVGSWSNSYERDLDDMFEMQSGIAIDIARELGVELSAAERQRVEHVPTTDPQAREWYLRARGREWSYYRPDEIPQAIDEVERALRHDDKFAEAWVLDSVFHNYAVFFEPGKAQEHLMRAEQAARRAIDLDPELGEAHAVLGWSLYTKMDWKGAEASLIKAKNRNVPTIYMGNYGFLKLSAGHFDLARDIFDEARVSAPQHPTVLRYLAFVHAALGDWERANELYEFGARLFRGDNVELDMLRIQQMHWLVSRKEFSEARDTAIHDPLNIAMLALLDTPAEALIQLRAANAAAATGPLRRPRDIGLWAGHFGDPQLALGALREAINEQGGGLTVYFWMPQLAPMRKTEEFEAYLREIGMVDYWEEYGWPSFCNKIDEHDFECH